MPRRARTLIGGYAYHVLNRANGRLRVFRKEADFAAFGGRKGVRVRRHKPEESRECKSRTR
jgi:hypothetical protein